jgi:hypothetical protein
VFTNGVVTARSVSYQLTFKQHAGNISCCLQFLLSIATVAIHIFKRSRSAGFVPYNETFNKERLLVFNLCYGLRAQTQNFNSADLPFITNVCNFGAFDNFVGLLLIVIHTFKFGVFANLKIHGTNFKFSGDFLIMILKFRFRAVAHFGAHYTPAQFCSYIPTVLAHCRYMVKP